MSTFPDDWDWEQHCLDTTMLLQTEVCWPLRCWLWLDLDCDDRSKGRGALPFHGCSNSGLWKSKYLLTLESWYYLSRFYVEKYEDQIQNLLNKYIVKSRLNCIWRKISNLRWKSLMSDWWPISDFTEKLFHIYILSSLNLFLTNKYVKFPRFHEYWNVSISIDDIIILFI